MHPLIDRLTEERGWALLDDPAALDAFEAQPGTHILFIPGDPAKTPEALDVAVILPELAAAFPSRFDCAIAGPSVERAARERHDVWPTPSLILLRDGARLGAIPKVRDWDDYLARLAALLGLQPA